MADSNSSSDVLGLPGVITPSEASAPVPSTVGTISESSPEVGRPVPACSGVGLPLPNGPLPNLPIPIPDYAEPGAGGQGANGLQGMREAEVSSIGAGPAEEESEEEENPYATLIQEREQEKREEQERQNAIKQQLVSKGASDREGGRDAVPTCFGVVFSPDQAGSQTQKTQTGAGDRKEEGVIVPACSGAVSSLDQTGS